MQERNRNKLKDYLTMAPSLGVTHLLALTLTDLAPSLRIVRLPAGPTLSFRVERYSLMKDILKTSRSSRSMGMEYLTAPLVSPMHPRLSLVKPRSSPGSPRVVSPTITRYAPASPPAHEIIPIPLPPAVPEYDLALQLPSDRPDRVQPRHGDGRLPTLRHRREALWRFEARPARPRRRPQKTLGTLHEWFPGPWKREGRSGLLA